MDGPRAHDVGQVRRLWRAALVRGSVVTSVAWLGAATAHAHLNADLLAHLPYTQSAGVWGYSAPNGVELAIIGTLTGTSFVDVTDPATAHEVAFIPGNISQWREIRTWLHYAYITTEGRPSAPDGPAGLQIVDLADPAHPVLSGYYNETFTTAHSIGIYEGYAYINGSKYGNPSAGMRILSLADPVHPVDVGAYTQRYVHDCYVRGNIGYLCCIGVGLAIVDLTDKAHPHELSFSTYLTAATHNAALSPDGRLLYTTDETPGGRVRIWDIVQPTAPFQEGEWWAHPVASVHNIIVQGDSAYVSYYTEGVMVLDLQQQDLPRVVAAYDTYPGIAGGFNGCWGVYPCRRTGNIYASDILGGLFVIGLRPQVATTLQSFEAHAVPAGVTLDWTLARDAQDAGALVVQRAERRTRDAPFGAAAFRARLPFESARWQDRDIQPGGLYSYRLLLDTRGALRSLGEVAVEVAAPAVSRLLGAAPNPFNPRTQIRFELARAGDVRLRIFDARGRLLRTLCASGLTPGAHAVEWDGRDAAGRGVPSGAYGCELESGAWRARARLVLAK